MQHNLDPCRDARLRPEAHQAGPAQRQRLRDGLARFAGMAALGTLPLRLAGTGDALVPGGRGHFHLGAELFLQLSGRTDFTFPNGRIELRADEALLIPAKVLHDEWVQADGPAPDQAFANIVIYAEPALLSCHLAHEQRPGHPGLLHLEVRRHAQAVHVQDWLGAAARLCAPSDPNSTPDPLALTQARALICAAISGTLRALDEAAPASGSADRLPSLLAHAQRLIQNQLGDQALNVRRLAEQCGCTPDHLSHLFHRHGGEHLAAHINRLRVERAARLLQETALSGKEIAWACGFAGPSYFIRTFRRHHGCTPQEYRGQMLSAPAGIAVGPALDQ